MNIQQLNYFVTSAQLLNFTTAANQHYVTQPTIWRQINELETQLGTKLFNRSTHGISLTRTGHEFYDYALNILQLAEQAITRIQRFEEGSAGFIRISTLPTSVEELTVCIAAFSNLYPDVQIDIDVPTGSGQIFAINNGNYDFFFAYTSMIERKDHLEHVNSVVDCYCLVFHRKFEALVTSGGFSALSNCPFVMISQSNGPIIYGHTLEICRSRGFEPKIMNHYTHAASTLISVNAGVGFTILPMSLISSSRFENIVVIPIEGEDAIVPYSIAWPKQNPNKAACRFKEIVLGLYKCVSI